MSDVTLDQAFEAAGRISESIMELQLFAADLDDDQFSHDVARVVAVRAALTRAGDRLARMRHDVRELNGAFYQDVNDRRSRPTLDGTAPSARQERE